MSYETLLEKINSKTVVASVIGLGYVGLPLAIEMAKSGLQVIAIDIDKVKIQKLKNGISYVVDIDQDELTNLVKTNKLIPTTDFSMIAGVDTVSICVPTPLRKTKDPDISYINSAVEQIKKYMHKNLLIILESTTYPGTTEEIIEKELSSLGFNAGKDYWLCFSPERVDPGNPEYCIKNTPKVIGGTTEQCSTLAKTLYGMFIDTIVTISSTKAAEMVKLLENTFRAVNIALVNEMTLMCSRMGIDVWEVIDAAATKPFGFMSFFPGPGIGGHCIPLDPMYLSWKAKMYDFYNRFIELASDINGNMPYFVLSKFADILNQHGRCIKGTKILILGVAYKKNIDDVRESPALEVYEMLKRKEAVVEYSDPFVETFKDKEGNFVHSVELTQQKLLEADCVILLTNHSLYNYNWIFQNSKLVFDTRNAFKNVRSKNIYKL